MIRDSVDFINDIVENVVDVFAWVGRHGLPRMVGKQLSV